MREIQRLAAENSAQPPASPSSSSSLLLRLAASATAIAEERALLRSLVETQALKLREAHKALDRVTAFSSSAAPAKAKNRESGGAASSSSSAAASERLRQLSAALSSTTKRLRAKYEGLHRAEHNRRVVWTDRLLHGLLDSSPNKFLR